MEELNRVIYKNHRIIEFSNESKKYISTFKIFDSTGKYLTFKKAKNSVICLSYCKRLIDKYYS